MKMTYFIKAILEDDTTITYEIPMTEVFDAMNEQYDSDLALMKVMMDKYGLSHKRTEQIEEEPSCLDCGRKRFFWANFCPFCGKEYT